MTVSNCTISGDDNDGIGNIGTLTVSNCTISGNGRGIGNGGTLTVNNCTISGNRLEGIYNYRGTLTVSNTTISGNRSVHSGGILSAGTLTVSNSIISGNSGSGIFVSVNPGDGIVRSNGTVSNSTISGNRDGGLFNEGTLTVSNCTINGNISSSKQTAAGIGNYAGNSDATLFLVSCTVSNNTVTSSDRTGSQLYSGAVGAGGTAYILFRNTIISGDGRRPNFFADNGGRFVSGGHNLSSDNGSGFLTGPGDLINTDPLLGPLQDNGGPTFTRALLPGSPAIDAGENTGAPEFDQRGPGFPRIVGGVIDIGAFEVQPGPATHFQLRAPAHVTSGMTFDVTVAALDAYGHTAAGYLGTVTFRSSDTDLGVVLPADYTFTADDGGMHTFAGGFTLVTAGDQTLTATDTADQTITGSATVTVAPGPTPPPGGRANGRLSPTVSTGSTLEWSAESGQHVVLLDQLFASVSERESWLMLARLIPHGTWEDLFHGIGEVLV